MLPLNKNGKLMFFMAGAFLGVSSAHSVIRVAVSVADCEESMRVYCPQGQPYGVQKAERAFSDGTRLLNLCNKFYSTVNRESSAYKVGEEDCRLLCRLALGKVRRGLYLAQKAPSRELAASLRECENALREYRMEFENWTSKDSKVRKHLKTVDCHVRKVAKFRESLTRLNGGYEGSGFEVKKCSCELPSQGASYAVNCSHQGTGLPLANESESAMLRQEAVSQDGIVDLERCVCDMMMLESRLSSDRCLLPDEFRRSFEMVEDTVTTLLSQRGYKVFDDVGRPMLTLCSSAIFTRFISFCSSDSCTLAAKKTAKEFLLLGCRALNEIQEEKLAAQVKQHIADAWERGRPLVTEQDRSLFLQVHKCFAPLLLP